MAKGLSNKAKSKNKNKFVRLAINRIELLEHTINTPTHIDYSKANNFNFVLKAIVNLNREKSVVQIVISYQFYYEDEVLFTMNVSNEFHVFELSDFFIDDKRINSDLLISLAGMSLTQSRGVQSTLIAKTKIDFFYIPAIPRERMLEKINYVDELLESGTFPPQ